MDDLFKTRIINNENKEQDELKIENFKPLSDLIKTDLLLQPSTMNNKKVALKKSSSYSSFNNNQEVNLENKTLYIIQYPQGNLSVSYGIFEHIYEDKNKFFST